ncbi:hypothetical protein PT974_10787 [Cladobotryum mycophilum]|uniref:Uncharacterized protein n=1 Tax=Cladobotryum mycophilum TaxID=491253 RepID=A0ABR0SAT4_9HYPO
MTVVDESAPTPPLLSFHSGSNNDDVSSTPTTATTPASTPFLPVADRVCTPLSLFVDSALGSNKSAKQQQSPSLSLAAGDLDNSAAAVRQRYLSMSPTAGAGAGAAGITGIITGTAATRPAEHAAAAAASFPAAGSVVQDHPREGLLLKHGIARGVISAQSIQSPNARARGQQHEQRQHYHNPPNPVARHPLPSLPPLDTAATSLLSPDFDDPVPAPLRTGILQPDTITLAHPKPILHATAESNNIPIKSPIPDLTSRSASALGNIAQLEATAERLSMTSSIDDAIRELHGELKRSDSRRSSILAASIRAASADENSTAPGRLRRHPSTSSSIIARQRGYSPATYVMSPTNSITGRMRSGSKTSTGRPDFDGDTILSRHGPGKGSVRSVRSARPSLAEISESEPISLTRDAFDQADAAPISQLSNDDNTRRILEQDAVNMPNTDEFHRILEGGFTRQSQNLTLVNPDQPRQEQRREVDRPATANSTNTYQQAQDAFIDFDGVHCEDEERPLSPEVEVEAQPEPQPEAQRRLSAELARPQTFYDQRTGQQMLYYPARVPAMLNLPPKLSSKPKVTTRNERRSQILTAMMEEKSTEAKRKSAALDQVEKSWLPDPVSGHRNSFAALSADELGLVDQATAQTEPAPETQAEQAPAASPLRRPQKLTKADPEKRKSKASQLDHIPAALRASVFFELPSESPEIEIKDGSAMATLESILDASARAPVSAFTDHVYAGKLGPEIYGKDKRHKSHASVPSLSVTAAVDPQSKKRSSVMMLNNRANSHNSEDKSVSDPSIRTAANGEHAQDADGERVIRVGEEHDEAEDEEVGEEDVFQGPPTTLLAELQLRKQQQKQRLRNPIHAFPEGMRATLLEMDAVAEVQRKQRQNKRVNLAWEEGENHVDQHESDDEDVPLAIIAAMQQGAKNMADIDRPLGLMEIRELEDNEPLSSRALRLQGRGSSLTHIKRPSVMSLPATRLAEVQPAAGIPIIVPSPEPGEEEVEGETLGQRKKRLAETILPRARPVSGAFSAELLSQFGDLEDSKDGKDKSTIMRKDSKSPNLDGEEETLGQRRRRLQTEREAREREMSYGNLVGDVATRKPIARRVSMADVLAANQRRELDPGVEQQIRLEVEQHRVAMQDSQMAVMRGQMPTSLTVPGVARPGGYNNGAFNDGAGGAGDLQRLAKDYDPHAESRRLQQEEYRVAAQDAKISAIRTQMPSVLTGPDVNRTGGFRNGAYNDGSGGAGEELRLAKDFDPNADQKRLQEEAQRLATQEAKMAAIRAQMPAVLTGPNVGKAGGFRGGMYNDGTGGLVLEASRSSIALNNPGFAQDVPRKRASMMMMSTYSGAPMRGLAHQQSYSSLSGVNAMNNAAAMNMYGGNVYNNPYGEAMIQPSMTMPMAMTMNSASMDRVERWRQSVLP